MGEFGYTDGIRWYVVHTYSGYENKVKTNIEKIVGNRGLSDKILDVQIPTVVVEENDGEKIKQVEQKIYPSYVFVKMSMSDETWHVIRNITGVTGFVGPGSRPVPLSDAEVASMGVERVHVSGLPFAVGDSVTIMEGPLSGFIGRVEDISADQKSVKIAASMFGRETIVELEPTAVKALTD